MLPLHLRESKPYSMLKINCYQLTQLKFKSERQEKNSRLRQSGTLKINLNREYSLDVDARFSIMPP